MFIIYKNDYGMFDYIYYIFTIIANWNCGDLKSIFDDVLFAIPFREITIYN
jgi:hypothetical protein